MILNNQTIDVTKSNNFESTDFRIDARYKNKVLWMLINQYRFKIRTPIQEIVSNARDAQRENGNPDRPIKIQLPTKLEPTFIVRDYGVGMDEQRVKDIFTSFGASTKNADNSQTGGFGIGAKSPLAYTDSFNIKTYVDGQFWFYVVAKTADNGLSINLLGSGETTEENGTEVQIPVASGDTRKFVEAACRTTMFWDVRPIFNLSEEDLYKVGLGTEIAEGFTVHTKSSLGNLFDTDLLFVVDGIPYETDSYLLRKVKKLEEINEKINWGSQAVIKLNTGDIDLLQTRESIEETERTIAELQKIGFKAFSDLEQYLASCLNAKDLQGRIKQYKDVNTKFQGVGHHEFETFYIQSNDVRLHRNLNFLSYDFIDSYGRKTLTRPKRRDSCLFFAKFNREYIYLWDDLKDTESDNLKARRMRYFLEQNRYITPVLIEQSRATNFEYIRTLRMLGAKKLSSLEQPPKASKGSRKKAAKKKMPENIVVHMLDSYSTAYYNTKATRWQKTVKIADIQTNFVYAGYHESSSLDYSGFNYQIKEFYGLTACKLSKTDIKLIKDNPNFIHIDDFKANFKPTEDMINYFVKAISFEYPSRVKSEATIKLAKNISVNSTYLQDKVLTRMAQHVKLLEGAKKVHRDFEKLMGDSYKTQVQNRAKIVERFLNRVAEKYPLLTDRTERKDLINYVNKGA